MIALNVSAPTVVRLHEAEIPRELAAAIFDFINAAITNHVLVLLVRPLEFEFPSYCSKPAFQSLCDQYVSGLHTDDLWLKRSPVRPDVPVVRHSDYTPQEMFRRSRFYKQVLSQTGCDYGVSLVAWRHDTWLANLTVFRTKEQGDFTDAELPLLHECHLHFQSAVKRIAALHEEKLGNNSLATFIWSLPTAAIVLDWEMKLLHYNASAQELSENWRFGSQYAKTKKTRTMTVPGDILAMIQQQKQKLVEMKPNRPGGPNKIQIQQIRHPKLREFHASIYFLPSKSLANTKGNFLITLERQSEKPDKRETYDRFAHLSRRERDVVLSAAKGQTSSEIAESHGTSGVTVRKQLHSAYKKLRINSRFELIRMFSEPPVS